MKENNKLKKEFDRFIFVASGVTLIILTFFVSIIITSNIISKSKEQIQTISTLKGSTISLEFDSITRTLKDHASRPFIVNSLMQFDQNNSSVRDYFDSLSILGHTGKFSMLSFDKTYLFGNIPYKKEQFDKVIQKEIEHAIILVNSSGTFRFLVPVEFHGNAEGILIFETQIKSEDLFQKVQDGHNKWMNYEISQGNTKFKSTSKIRNIFKRSEILPLNHDLDFIINYDPSYHLQEVYAYIFITFVVLALLTFLLSTFFYKKGLIDLVEPYNQTIQMKNKLTQALSLNKTVINSVSHLVIGTDKNGTVLIFNNAAQKELGYETSEVINKETPALWHDLNEIIEVTNDLNEKYDSNLSPGFDTFVYEARRLDAPTETEWTFTRKDRTQFTGRLIVTVLKNEEDEVFGYLGVIENITLIKKAKEELIKSNKMKSEFLANMSHEIRTPMNGVLGMISLLERTEINKEQSNLIKTMKDSGEILLNIINDILDISKIEAGKLELEEIPFNVSQSANDIVSLFKSKGKDKGIEVSYDNSFDEDKLWVKNDPVRFKQILINIISNAIKFTMEGSVIVRLKSLTRDEALQTTSFEIEINDTGIGIKDERLDDLFNKFSQADSSITRMYGGTGLGLAICKKLVDLLKGEIEVNSIYGEGTTFHLRFTFASAQPIIDNIDETETNERDFSKKYPLKILLAEDNLINQKFAKLALAKLGYKIDIVNDGVECLEALTEKNYDLIFMDLQMPNMDGITATKEIIKKYGKDSPLIYAMSANVFKDDKDKAAKAGMKGFVAKPVTIERLKEVLVEVKKEL